MAISVVQSRSVEGGGGATSLSLAFSSNVTAGNALLLANGGGSTGQTPTVTSSPSNTFAYDFGVHSGGQTLFCDFFSTPSATGGATTLTFNCTAGSPTLYIYEVSGLAASSIADVSAGLENANLATVNTGVTATTTQANEFCFALCGTNNDTVAPTVTSGWTLGEVQTSQTNNPGAVAYKVVSSTGTQTCDFTYGVACPAVCAIITYKGASAGAGSDIPAPLHGSFQMTQIRM